MKIVLIGYGKMGKAIEEIILEENKHEIVLKISSDNIDDFTIENLKQADIAIEFTQPDRAFDNVMKCFEAGIPVVSGTTAWHEGLEKAKIYCTENSKTLFVASNFSIGVNIFFQLNKYLNKMMASFDTYRLSMKEIHHTQKKDAPSGTAVKLAEDILAQNKHYKGWELADNPTELDIITIKALREENVPGTHFVNYTSDIDNIEISHTAYNRKGFAEGAVRAAEFLYGKSGYYTMDDLLKF